MYAHRTRQVIQIGALLLGCAGFASAQQAITNIQINAQNELQFTAVQAAQKTHRA